MNAFMSSKPSQNSVLILYPWGIDSVINKNIGAGLRIGLLAEFLNNNGYSVTVVSVGFKRQHKTVGKISFIQIRFPSNVLLTALYAVAIIISKLFKTPSLQAFIYFFFHRLDKGFIQTINNHVNDCSSVLLEYPFWYSIIDIKKAVLTDHDIMSESWTRNGIKMVNSLFNKILFTQEIKALSSCFQPVVVSEDDKSYFVEHGISNIRVIVNPIKLPDSSEDSIFQEIIQTSSNSKKDSSAIFIGSGWYPNIAAAQDIIDKIAMKCPSVNFFIVGECCSKVKNVLPNVKCLGRVTSEELSRLYSIATYALVPVLWGTGTSLKTVEAMAYGKVILSTQVGVRGIKFEHMIHGVICDDISRYAQLINMLEEDVLLKEALSSNAKTLANRYEYNLIFQDYLDILNKVGQATKL